MKKNKSVFRALAMVMQFGLNMLVPILMCTLLGVWIGNKWDIPIIVIPLFLAGAFAGFQNIFRMAKSIYQDEKTDTHKKN